MKGYNLEIPITVRFKDTDQLGHVNNANYLVYMEAARMEYFRQTFGDNVNWLKQGVILARAEVDFLLPIFMHDAITVCLRCSRIGNKSFDLDYKIIRKKDNLEEIVGAGMTVLVAYNYGNNETIPIPETWKKSMEEFDGNGG